MGSRDYRSGSTWRRISAVAGATALVVALLAPALAKSPGPHYSAAARSGYVAIATKLTPRAERGDANAQTRLGYLYATGRGVPQNMTLAAYWYERAAEQGQPMAQFLLGLQYDKGQGVPYNVVESYRWLNLAAASAGRAERDDRVRMRDAVLTKMTRGEIARARLLSVTWVPRPER